MFSCQQNSLYFEPFSGKICGTLSDMKLSAQIEGVLFFRAAPMKLTQLASMFAVEIDAITEAIGELAVSLQGHGIALLRTETEVQLATAPAIDALIEAMRKDELKRDIGKAGAETLAIILYRGPISRAEIDRIRGVNSGFILRNLMIRGLIERNQEGRGHTFTITPALLAHLGITHKTELPNYAAVLDQLERFEADQDAVPEAQ
jgi:segregation and condensation protein B